MMDITGKIIFGIVLEGQVDDPNTGRQSSNQNSKCGRGGNQNRGRGHGYNPQQNQPPAYEHSYNPPQGQYPYMNQAPV